MQTTLKIVLTTAWKTWTLSELSEHSSTNERLPAKTFLNTKKGFSNSPAQVQLEIQSITASGCALFVATALKLGLQYPPLPTPLSPSGAANNLYYTTLPQLPTLTLEPGGGRVFSFWEGELYIPFVLQRQLRRYWSMRNQKCRWAPRLDTILANSLEFASKLCHSPC